MVRSILASVFKLTTGDIEHAHSILSDCALNCGSVRTSRESGAVADSAGYDGDDALMGPGFRRPILIVQSDDFNRSRISTVVGAVITSNRVLAGAPGNVRIPARASGLNKASVVNLSQIITVDKSYLTERVGTLKVSYIRQVDDGLRLVLSI